MTKNDQAPTGANILRLPGNGNSPSAQPSHVAYEAVVALSLAEIARVGVGLNRLALWITGADATCQITDVDLTALEAASALVREIHEQIYESSINPAQLQEPVHPPEIAEEMAALIKAGTASEVYGKLAALMGVPYDAGEVGSIHKLARRCVAKLEHDKLRKG